MNQERELYVCFVIRGTFWCSNDATHSIHTIKHTDTTSGTRMLNLSLLVQVNTHFFIDFLSNEQKILKWCCGCGFFSALPLILMQIYYFHNILKREKTSVNVLFFYLVCISWCTCIFSFKKKKIKSQAFVFWQFLSC